MVHSSSSYFQVASIAKRLHFPLISFERYFRDIDSFSIRNCTSRDLILPLKVFLKNRSEMVRPVKRVLKTSALNYAASDTQTLTIAQESAVLELRDHPWQVLQLGAGQILETFHGPLHDLFLSRSMRATPGGRGGNPSTCGAPALRHCQRQLPIISPRGVRLPG